MTNKKQWRLSASFISAFKACAMRCHNKYVVGIRTVEDTESKRMGTNWHKIQEIYSMKPGAVCPECSKTQKQFNCVLCDGTDILPDDMMDAVLRHLNQAYAECPQNKTLESWEAERIILLYSLVGYKWYYGEPDYIVVDRELRFRIPLCSPTSGRALPHVVVDGCIDKIVKNADGDYCIWDHKSTGKSLDSDSTFWNHLALDTQTTLYPHAAAQLDDKYHGIKVLYDAWHKPQIRPKKLTQGESKKFVENGEYMGEKFEVTRDGEDVYAKVLVNGSVATMEPGAKEGTFAIRETAEMFGARLLKDITERPEFYFVRRDIPRTSDDIERFKREIYNIYQTVRLMYKNNSWYRNEQQCEATFKCDYINLCYNNITPKEGEEVEGFENIFNKKKEKE